MQDPIQITQYTLAGFVENPIEAKTFLQKYAKGSYDDINRFNLPQPEIDYINELFNQINMGGLTFVEANRLYNLFVCGDKEKHNLFASEKQFEEAICAYLTRSGIKYESQVKCFSGIADIITNSYIMELKLTYNDSDLRHAIGQVIAYSLEEKYRNKIKIILFPTIPDMCNQEYYDYLKFEYNIIICDVPKFRYIMSLDDSKIDISGYDL